MGAGKFRMFRITTRFGFANREVLKEALYRNMFTVADSFKLFVSKFLVFAFGSFVAYIFSFRLVGESHEKNLQSICDGNDQIDTSCCQESSKDDEFGQKEKGFRVHDDELVDKTDRGKDYSVVMKTALVSSTKKYQFSSEKHMSGFIQEPKKLICSVQDLYICSSNSINSDNGILVIFDGEKADDSVDKILKKQEEQKSFVGTIENFDQAKRKDYVDKVLKKQEEETHSIDTGEIFDQEKTEESVENALKKQEEIFPENEHRIFREFRFLPKYDISNEDPHHSEDFPLPIDSKFDTIGSGDGLSSSNDDSNFDVNEFLTERSFNEGLGSESLEAVSEEKVENTERILDRGTSVMGDETFGCDDECIELEPESESSSVFEEEIWSVVDLIHAEEKHEDDDLFHVDIEPAGESQLENSAFLDDEILNVTEDNHGEHDILVHEGLHLVNSFANSEEPSLEEKVPISDYGGGDDSGSNFDSEFEFEFELEHDGIIEQLRMELKLARTGGLPTILEESESPSKLVEELKPLKIDHKFEHKDLTKEIQKFYRSYLDKMRKLDILNSQTMHAIGLLQLKHPAGRLIKAQKSAVPAIKSLLTKNLWPCKPRRSEVNPKCKFIEQLHKDFELVYVEQLCLSWEILHWQYRKALELQEFDPQELRQYNQVANEFQLFQVLLQRFVENEPFQGCPRVENYVNNRCVHCNFLQVPIIQDDSLKDKKGRKGDVEDAITSTMLVEIIEESMRVFWEFLGADKDDSDAILRGPELQDSVDSNFLADIRTDLQKKDKRLKEIVRSGSCIVKKLQKHHENRSNRALFFAQVELKLISRLLTMSKLTTDQLVWCHEKLSKINCWNRRLVLEPSFLLFPC